MWPATPPRPALSSPRRSPDARANTQAAELDADISGTPIEVLDLEHVSDTHGLATTPWLEDHELEVHADHPLGSRFRHGATLDAPPMLFW